MSSFLSRMANEATAALTDAYGHVMHGDDAGSSARVVWIVHPTKVPLDIGITDQKSPSSGTLPYLFTQKFDLGLTFLEVNDRAYVRTVSSNCNAALAGVEPQDCVQFACVVGGPQFEEEKYRRHDNDRRLDAKATKFVLECERRGMRTSYEELRDLFAGCTLAPKDESDFTTTPQRKGASSPSKDDDADSLLQNDSVGGTFEQGRGKKLDGVSSRCVPAIPDQTAQKVTRTFTKAARSAAGRCFVGDDDGEFDERFRRKSDAGGSLLDTPLSPIKNDMMSSSPRNTYGDSVMEQQLYPVAMVFRRTVQRKRMSPNRGWGGPGLSIRGSLFGIPSFRMDDECDRAAALIRQLAPSQRTHAESAAFPDDGESTLASASPDHLANDDIEASTIRGMIQNAVGLAFVRTSKVVVGVSLQGGSGIIIARLADGTWSAPSAIGVCGLGVGLQFGLEVADYMFILQSKEGVEHFQHGGNFAVGGNIGAAVAGVGREAYGAASLGACGARNLEDQVHQGDTDEEDDDGMESTYYEESTRRSVASSSARSRKIKNNDSDIAPIVAYAKSQGLYFGVSVDGLRFFTRNDINSRAYKFAMLSEMAAKDILTGLVAPPPVAEDLYAALHSVEFKHEITELPRPPEILRKDSLNDWRFDRSIAAIRGEIVDNTQRISAALPTFSFLSTLSREEADECALFETKFKKFLYGGVAVQRLMPNSAPLRSGMTRRERRTLWLMLPEVGSLRLGFVSKVKDGGDGTMDDVTVATSIAGSKMEADDITEFFDSTNVKLSKKHSISLTDITVLSQDPYVTVRLSPDDATEHLRVVSIQDFTGKYLMFLANTFREAELLVCGLKLLLERESARLSVRGGMQLNKLGGKLGKGALSPSAARGLKEQSSGYDRSEQAKKRHFTRQTNSNYGERSKYSSIGEPGTNSDSSSDSNDDDDSLFTKESEFAKLSDRHQVPEGRRSWSQVPSRSHLREVASQKVDKHEPNNSAASTQMHSNIPTYVLGNEVNHEIATNVSLPLPLPLSRVLFLDSTSPVNKAWESGRGDQDFQRSNWAFPAGSKRELEQNHSEQQLISSGSMVGAHRIISYARMRNRELVRLSETIVVEKDDHEALVFSISDRMPRRGFSVKSRVVLRSHGAQRCQARIIAELRPVGKNLSNQLAVHKACLLVVDEIKLRLGAEGKGLLAVFFQVYTTMSGGNNVAQSANIRTSPRKPQSNTTRNSNVMLATQKEDKKASLTSFKDVLPSGNRAENITPRPFQGNNSVVSQSNKTNKNIKAPIAIKPQTSPRKQRKEPAEGRPGTPSFRAIDSKSNNMQPKKPYSAPPQDTFTPVDDFADFSNFDDIPRKPMTVEVKPLPKIRLDLCPVPREEDEEEDSNGSFAETKHRKRSKHSKHRHRGRKSLSHVKNR